MSNATFLMQHARACLIHPLSPVFYNVAPTSCSIGGENGFPQDRVFVANLLMDTVDLGIRSISGWRLQMHFSSTTRVIELTIGSGDRVWSHRQPASHPVLWPSLIFNGTLEGFPYHEGLRVWGLDAERIVDGQTPYTYVPPPAYVGEPVEIGGN